MESDLDESFDYMDESVDWEAFNDDHLGSDDLDDVLELSLREYASSNPKPSKSRSLFKPAIPSEHRTNDSTSRDRAVSTTVTAACAAAPVASGSSSKSRPRVNAASAVVMPSSNLNETMPDQTSEPIYVKRQELNAELAEVEAKIRDYDDNIKKLNSLRGLAEDDKRKILEKIASLSQSGYKGKENASHGGGIQYMSDDFDWMDGLRGTMKRVFGIDEFRLCQQGVCNANMDGRDIICVMPTGGGKSLTYQLPALLLAGCTLVISPLLSLMTDQVLHLREVGVEAVKLTGTTSKTEKNDILRRLTLQARRKLGPEDKPIKLCYVTPEKLEKDKRFVSLLQSLAEAGQLARIVIDEAHCVSQMGHDFRPDYQKLSKLRSLYPKVPILALSATCPPAVMKDLLKTLRMGATVDGNNANKTGTVYFTSSLYRKNLHYKVVPKPPKEADLLKAMAEYILEHHPDQTGIVYCSTKKEAETVSHELREISQGKIRVGVYHAEVPDAAKENLHIAWREGKIKVVCATIAFGMGIDKGDVRFVLHHSISKSLEGYYQETGRAGRDGKDADCILYYLPHDGLGSIPGKASQEPGGEAKVMAMLEFAEDLKQCRKLQFANYFSHSSDLSLSAWGTADEGALDRCGHCDNCTRPPDSLVEKDVTVATWQILQVVTAVKRHRGNLTLRTLVDLARGNGGGAFEIGKGKKAREKINLDLENLAGGAVDMSKLDLEHLVIHLLIQNYLKQSFRATEYRLQVYLVDGLQAQRLIHRSRESLHELNSKIVYTFKKPVTRSKKSGTTAKGSTQPTIPRKRKAPATNKVSRTQKVPSSEDDGDEDDLYVDDDEGDPQPIPQAPPVKSTRQRSSREVVDMGDDDIDSYECDSDDEVIDYDWSNSYRKEPQAKRRRGTQMVSGLKVIQEGENEILILSD
ncbi:P-loop containing nucleoside triphosphate hydrolase protein [Cyathus striatus]|nr:P-loop containing nucleoside triphosphate hydrolase protein [Cyathus striatus]